MSRFLSGRTLLFLAIVTPWGFSPLSLAPFDSTSVSQAHGSPRLLQEGVRNANAALRSQNRRLARRIQTLLGIPSSQVTVKNLGGAAAQTSAVEFSYKDKTARLVLRLPRRGPAWGIENNRVMQLLAAQMGDPDMVPSASEHVLNASYGAHVAGTPIMIMAHVGSEFQNAWVQRGWLKSTSETSRLRGAIIDILADYHDRKTPNLMVNAQGQIRLVDPDSSFGAKKGVYRSAFFPGRPAGYSSAQSQFADLPSDMQTLIASLADSSAKDIAQTYEIPLAKAETMHRWAGQIKTLGLDGAVQSYLANAGRRLKEER